MKTYRFNELSKLAQMKAIVDYNDGWVDNHGDDNFSIDEIIGFLDDLDKEGYKYDKRGYLQELQDGE